MSVDRTFPHDAEPLVFEEQKTPAAARKIRPLWYKRFKRLVADVGALEDSVAALPDSQDTLVHGQSDDLETFAGLGHTLDIDASIPRHSIIMTGAFTIRAPTADGSCVLLIRSLATASITLSGFSTQTAYLGASMSITSGDWFLARIDRIADISFIKFTQEAT